jgi:nitroimidazol reductase NimA-like FMN-containing flavoprotein (pyridoxamine 5'-phosphate oxidase superfamily)
MRKKEREITDPGEVEFVIKRAIVCRIALSDNNVPYLVPVNFGYQDGCLYIHTAGEGMKIDIIRRNNRVCFEMEADLELTKGPTACKWGMRYSSVIGFGRASLVEGSEEKRAALDIIMRHYSGDSHDYSEKLVDKVAIIRVEIDTMTGKQSGY